MNKQQLTRTQFARQPAIVVIYYMACMGRHRTLGCSPIFAHTRDDAEVFIAERQTSMTHVVLVDFSPPFGSDSCSQVQQALQDILALAANITGPPRVPFFGLFAIGTYPEALLPLQAVRGNLSKIHTAIQELRSFQREGLVGGKTAGCLGQGLQDAMAQFKRQQHLYKQLELMVVTCRPSALVNKEVEKACSVLDMDVLKKVQVVCLSQPEDLGASDICLLDTSPSGSAASGGEAGLSCGMVDVVHLDNDGVSLHQFLKGWLVDSGTDREHLHLTLPGMAGIGALTFKCDLSERILDPTHLLQPLNFSLLPDTKHLTSSAQSRTTASAAPVHKLTAIKLVNMDSICESVVYGMPLVVCATSCWKLDWEELESNQTNFHALCHLLQEKGLAILAAADVPPGQHQQKSVRPVPKPHFLLLPSQSSSLLIKSVAVGELLLPCEFVSPAEPPSQEAVDTVDSSIAQLEVEAMFNPLLVKSGLYGCLTPHVRQQSAGTQGKRRFQYSATSQVPQSSMSSGPRHAPQQMRSAQTNQARANQRTALVAQTNQARPSQRTALVARPENNQRGRFCPPKAKRSRVFEQDDMFPDFTPDF